MIHNTRLTAAFAFAAGLTAAGMAFAQTQTGGTASPTASPPPAGPPWSKYEAPTIKPSDPNASQPTYGVDPPPEGASGIYLPAVVLGYAKSTAGCVVAGCEDGPTVGGAPAPSTPTPPEPPPPNPAPSSSH